MKKKCKVLIIPTDKESKIILTDDGLNITHHQTNLTGYHVYILSDDRINKGDWYIKDGKVNKKIIATTDSLDFVQVYRTKIKNTFVPQISEWIVRHLIDCYNKHQPIEQVYVHHEKKRVRLLMGNIAEIIIIPPPIPLWKVIYDCHLEISYLFEKLVDKYSEGINCIYIGMNEDKNIDARLLLLTRKFKDLTQIEWTYKPKPRVETVGGWDKY